MFSVSSIRKQTEKGNKKRINKTIKYIKQRIKDRSYYGYNFYTFDGYYVCETKDEVEVIANYFISKGFTISDRKDWEFDICW
jgi:hypothetical protein